MSHEQPSYPEPVRPQPSRETPADQSQTLPLDPPFESPHSPAPATPTATYQAPQPSPYATPGAAPGHPVYTTPANPANPLAVTSMICSFVAPASWLFSWIPVLGVILMAVAVVAPILAVIFGHIALSQIRKSTQGGRGIALTGLIVGYVTIGLTLLLVLIAVVAIILFGGTFLALVPALAAA
ncbi:DUF4190 domain-containing protein [Microbacterium sp. G2-8]|uniref:DUF4190 domain-containing protein n=1 Tax=Microbacterium sp. G2-8 TaxID=2842454 RepID=UPI001C8A939A|nr:DUF4190 domain-containing protein [Microbacterium sp. G2-8]